MSESGMGIADVTDADQQRESSESENGALASGPIRVFVADEQPLFREGVRLILQDSHQAVLVGEAASGKETLQLLERAAPDVCVIDGSLPLGGQALGFGDPTVPGGIELGRMIKHRSPDVSVVIFAGHEQEEQLFQAMKIGASAYCLRDIRPEALLDMISRVHRGEYLMSDSVLERPQMTERVLKQFRELSASRVGVEPLYVPLSSREIEILDHIAHGHSNKSIAKELSISDQTVKNHITSVLRKLAVNDRTQAVIYALRHNWIKL